jgi:hypothetical protein
LYALSSNQKSKLIFERSIIQLYRSLYHFTFNSKIYISLFYRNNFVANVLLIEMKKKEIVEHKFILSKNFLITAFI